MNDENDLKEALRKCAVGFNCGEVVEEFAMQDGELKLVKRKVTRRDVPPDIKAVKLLMDGEGVESMSDEELESEKLRLLKMLKEEEI